MKYHSLVKDLLILDFKMQLNRPIPKPNLPLFVSHPAFRKPAWGNNHPLAIPRQTAMLDLCNLLGWLDDDNTRIGNIADRETLI
ncbi:hypothetical protein MNBD_ALPHA06-139, partial [hydrothermal vent metagenome]